MIINVHDGGRDIHFYEVNGEWRRTDLDNAGTIVIKHQLVDEEALTDLLDQMVDALRKEVVSS